MSTESLTEKKVLHWPQWSIADISPKHILAQVCSVATTTDSSVICAFTLSLSQQLAPAPTPYLADMSPFNATPTHLVVPATTFIVLHASIHCCSVYAMIPVMSAPGMLTPDVQL